MILMALFCFAPWIKLQNRIRDFAKPFYTKEAKNMIKEAIRKVVRGDDLTEAEMERAMNGIMSGNVAPAQIGAFVTALRLKGETVDEITGAARAMRAREGKMNVNNHLVNIDRDEINVEDETILNTSGTGGDGTNTFNVSTATAFVAAGGGVKVAKHGNRAVSSLCGSADVLENLGVKLDINHSDMETCIREIGIGFLYSPLFHGAMKHAVGTRQEIGIRTIFNLLGPLTNPAGASAQVLGVYDPVLTEKIATVLDRLGTREAFVVCGEGTFDEISICGPTRVSHLKEGKVNTFDMTPEEYGFKRAAPEAIRGGDAKENAQIIRNILDGVKGPKRDMVVLNASAAFVTTGLGKSFEEGIGRAKDSIDSGKAREKLLSLVDFTQECSAFVRKDL
jgi:anthranilate phosphoribosyltransferase